MVQPVARVGLVSGMRRLLRAAAGERLGWIRENLRTMMTAADVDAAAIHALAGVSPGTVRNFLAGTDSSLGNVLLMCQAMGVELGDLERPPDEFRELLAERMGR